MSQCERIFIIGHPGTGKMLFARTLAEKLNWQLIDADFGLEIAIGRSVLDILGKEGAKHFYQCQSEILAAQIQKTHVIVVTDACVMNDEKNQQLLAKELVVYLRVSTPVQLERTARNAAPLLSPDLAAFLEKLHQERDGFYEQAASLSINVNDSDLEKHVSQVLQKVKATSSSSTLDKKQRVFFHKQLHTPVQLSKQQAICLKLLAQGNSSKEIAQEMDISYRTVEGYIAKMMEVLGCSSSKELIALYYDQP